MAVDPLDLAIAEALAQSPQSQVNRLAEEINALNGQFQILPVEYTNVAQNTAVQVMGGNNQRFSFLIAAQSAAGIAFYGPDPNVNASQGGFLGANSDWRHYSYRQVGPLVCQPWFVFAAAGDVTIAVIEVIIQT